jgi:hypothetical protein
LQTTPLIYLNNFCFNALRAVVAMVDICKKLWTKSSMLKECQAKVLILMIMLTHIQAYAMPPKQFQIPEESEFLDMDGV